MTETSDHVIVNCPSGEAAEFITEFFDRLGAPEAEGAVLTLHIPVGDATISRDVVAKLTAPKATPGHRVMGLTWAPKGGGPYPVFEGTLALSDQSAATSRLTIVGKYGPPGGVVGAAFDAMLGRRMAVASLKALLETLKTAIEAARKETALAAARYLPTYE